MRWWRDGRNRYVKEVRPMVTAHLAEEQTGVYRLQLEVWLRRQAILVSIGVFDGYSVAYTKQLANNRIEDFCYALGKA